MINLSPLPWGEGGESSEPGEGSLPSDPRNFGIRDYRHKKSGRHLRGARQEMVNT